MPAPWSSWLETWSLLTVAVPLLSLLWWLSTRRPPHLPPGPGPALPLLGHLHLMQKDPRAKFLQWRRQYGDVFSFYLGSKLVVVMVGYSAIHEALVKFADVFSDRPSMFITEKISKGKGIGGSSGALWKEQRKTSLEILRHMGMGKNMLAVKIQEEITQYVRAIQEHQGAPVDLARMTQVSVSNNICSILLGKRFEYDDPDFISYLEAMDENLKLLEGTAFVNFFPALERVPGDLFSLKKMMSNADLIKSFIAGYIQPVLRGKEGKENQESCNFIEAYVRQIHKHETSGNVNTTVNEENLLHSVNDLFGAGTETTSTTLRWAMLYFLHYPEVQDKCYKEICEVVGTERLPCMRDRPEMTYLEATLWEVVRKADIIPFSVQHGAAYDVRFRDYVIPKHAIIIPFQGSVLQDPEVWGDPENFRPERFIGPDGKLARPDEFIPFGIGRRVCLGESLARMELFLYLATLVQRFHFLPAADGQLPPLEGVLGLTYIPKNFTIRAVPRL